MDNQLLKDNKFRGQLVWSISVKNKVDNQHLKDNKFRGQLV